MTEERLEGERLQKVLAAAGISSRRHAENLITAGRVAVNGAIVTQLGTRVTPTDRIAVDGKLISRTPHYTYIMLNKPVGVLSTAHDERGRPSVVDLVRASQRVYPVGRLDLDSEGLLLLTNNGELTHRILHPRHELPREYYVWTIPPPSDNQIAQLRQGVEIDHWRTHPAEVTRRPGGALSMIIHEGHKRQVRLMCNVVGLTVNRLQRVRLGPVKLGSLKSGEWRELRPEELVALEEAVGMTEAPTTPRSPPPRRPSTR
ncbi:MAG TPA: pseudouridine synthase [Chloroflexota bacterium]|nr:pseudouridine synthase [Chloroflexota bacterium]